MSKSKGTKKKRGWLDHEKRVLVEKFGCSQCGAGKNTQGFVRFWESDPEPYEPRKFTFHHDMVGKMPVSMAVYQSNVTLGQLKDLVSQSIIICRGCMTRWARSCRTPKGSLRRLGKGPRTAVAGLGDNKRLQTPVSAERS